MTRVNRLLIWLVFLLNIPLCLTAQVWQKTYDFAPYDHVLDLRRNADGSYNVLSCSQSPDGGPSNVRLTRVSALGNLIWSASLPFFNADSLTSFMPMSPAPSGGYFLYAQREAWENNPQLFRFETDAYGGLVRADTFTFNGYKGLVFNKNVTDKAGNFYAAGQYWQSNPSDTTGYNICLLKTGPSGNTLWTRKLSFAQAPDRIEKFLTLGINEAGGISADWQQNYWFDGAPAHRFIQLDPEGGFIGATEFDVDEKAYYPEVQLRDSFFYYTMGQELDDQSLGSRRRLMKIGPDGQEIGRRYFPMASNTEWELSIASRDFLLMAETTVNESQTETQVVYQLIDKSTLEVVWSQSAGESELIRLQKILFLGQDSFLVAKKVYDDTGLSTSNIILEKQYFPSQNLVNLISGRVAADLDADCVYDDTDAALAQFVVKAEKPGATYYALSDSSGFYTMQLDTGTYTVSIFPPGRYWTPCVTGTQLQLQSGDSLRLDFTAEALIDCPYMEVSLNVNRLRRCFYNTVFLSYANKGTRTVDSARVELQLDPYLDLTASSVPATALGNGRWRFEVGSVAPFESGGFTATVYVDCATAVIGQTHCMEAYVYPDTICLADTQWSGAEIDVDIHCDNDSVYVVITNIGTAPTSVPCEYIVIEDDVILRLDEILLDPGDSITFVFPGNGSFWRVEASQEPGFPYQSMPSASLEGCGGYTESSLGLFPAYPQDDASFLLDIDCVQNVGSVEANSITGFPLGVGPEHYIYPNIDLEYMIHFQNTGGDTAFTVEIVDTLPPALVASSIVPGASSHPYTWDISGSGILRLLFEHISLPDSAIDEAASQGFVEFRVSQEPELPEKTAIANRAWVHFDFNQPVSTNYSRHTVRRVFLTVAAWEPAAPGRQLQVYPNPLHTGARLYLEGGVPAGETMRLQLIDAQGRPAARVDSTDGYFDFERQRVAPGLYFFRITTASGKWVGSGKIVVSGE